MRVDGSGVFNALRWSRPNSAPAGSRSRILRGAGTLHFFPTPPVHEEEPAIATRKDGTALHAVERRVRYGERPGFRITELQIGPTQEIPWHAHTEAQYTLYVLEQQIRLSLREPDEERQQRRGDIVAVPPGRPHRVTNGGDTSATFLVLQNGDYDYVPQRGSTAERRRTGCRWLSSLVAPDLGHGWELAAPAGKSVVGLSPVDRPFVPGAAP